MTLIWMIGGFILVLSPIIIVHELGHYWTAKYFKIKVEEFGLGYPPRAATLFERDGTKFTLNWIPFGGFVRPSGEDDPMVEGGLAAASRWARFCVLVAGSTANFVLAFLVLWVAFMIGQPIQDTSQILISGVRAESAGAVAGLQNNDLILAVDGERLDGDRAALIDVVQRSAETPITIIVDRGGRQVELTAVPDDATPDDPSNGGVLGIELSSPVVGRESFGPLAAAGESLTAMRDVIVLTARAPAMLIRNEISAQEARPIGIVGMSQIIGDQAQSATRTGDFFGLLFFAGIINLGLAVTNLLPIPALDGGRILFVLIEAVRGRRLEPEREGLVHMVGMLLLLGLMVLIIIQDIVNPVIPF